MADPHPQLRQIGQAVRTDGPQSHLSKSGTPTMGGALILSAIGISTLLWADTANRYVWVVLAVTLLFGAIGWVDDYRKVIEKELARVAKPLEVFLAVGVRPRCGDLPLYDCADAG